MVDGFEVGEGRGGGEGLLLLGHHLGIINQFIIQADKGCIIISTPCKTWTSNSKSSPLNTSTRSECSFRGKN